MISHGHGLVINTTINTTQVYEDTINYHQVTTLYRDQLRAQRSVSSMGKPLPLPFYSLDIMNFTDISQLLAALPATLHYPRHAYIISSLHHKRRCIFYKNVHDDLSSSKFLVKR